MYDLVVMLVQNISPAPRMMPNKICCNRQVEASYSTH